MAKKVEAWEADDGTLCKTEEEANRLSRELSRQGNLFEIASRIEYAKGANDMANMLVDEWPLLVHIVEEYEGPRVFTSSQLISLEKLNIWGSQAGYFTHISSMENNHLQNAYRIANEEKRPGYEVYRSILLTELTQRNLRTEVQIGES